MREPNLVLYKHIDKEKIDFLEFWFEDDDKNLELIIMEKILILLYILKRILNIF